MACIKRIQCDVEVQAPLVFLLDYLQLEEKLLGLPSLQHPKVPLKSIVDLV
jgi:hypothetical protein